MGCELGLTILLKEQADVLEGLKNFFGCLDNVKLSSFDFYYKPDATAGNTSVILSAFDGSKDISDELGRVFRELKTRGKNIEQISIWADSVQFPESCGYNIDLDKRVIV